MPFVLAQPAALYDLGTGLDAAVGGITLSGAEAACVRCHGHPLDGGGEGGVWAPPLAWSRLTSPTSKRPAYGGDTFARALQAGINSADQPLHVLMPRYNLTPDQLAKLITYLRSPADMRGVTPDRIRIATLLPALPALRQAGLAAESSLREGINSLNQQGGLFGRKLELITLDVDQPTDQLAAQLDAAAVLLLIGSVGSPPHGPVSDLLAARKILDLAPLTALTGNEDPHRTKALRPGLMQQTGELVRLAYRDHQCIDVDAGDDRISRIVAQSVDTMRAALPDVSVQTNTDPAQATHHNAKTTPPCPARLILRPISQVQAALARARNDGVSTAYLSAEQTGIFPTTQPNQRPNIVASAGGVGSLEAQARDNADKAMAMLIEALHETGRQITPGRLDKALDRAQARLRGKVRVLDGYSAD